ncbi:MAG TPA: creatininase family protein [Dongiaceae bacterium]|jgi:creatinine amidohydrolase|nr:creatininase family protein [Dongiaceae bacterium]
MKGWRLEQLCWPEVTALFMRNPVLILPIGAASKEHGPHLPMNTDALLAARLAEKLAERLAVLIAPAVPFGYYPAFRDFAGSQHLEAATFTAMVRELIENFIAQGLTRILVLNTGYSTEAPLSLVMHAIWERHRLRIAVADLRTLGARADYLWQQEAGSHADERETSLMLALAPECVTMARAVREMEPEPRTTLRRVGAPLGSSGVYGDATLATPEKGQILLEAILEDIVTDLAQIFPAVG